MSAYSVNNSWVDRTQHGTKRAAIPATVATGLGVAATLVKLNKSSFRWAAPRPNTLFVGLTAGAATATGIIASHSFGGSDNQRFGVAIGGTAGVAALGAGLISARGGASLLRSAGVAGVTGVVAGAASLALNSVLMSR